MPEFQLEKKDLKAKPRFWVTFNEEDAKEYGLVLTGSFDMELEYMAEADYQRLIEDKSEIKSNKLDTHLTRKHSLDITAKQQAELIVKGWHMPALRFIKSVPFAPERTLTNADTIAYSEETAYAFLRTNWAYANFVAARCKEAFRQFDQREQAASGNLPESSSDGSEA